MEEAQPTEIEDHNILFTDLFPLIKRIREQKQNQQLTNDEVKNFIPNSVKLTKILSDIDDVYEAASNTKGSKNSSGSGSNNNNGKISLLQILHKTAGYEFHAVGLLTLVQRLMGLFSIYLLDQMTNELKQENKDKKYLICFYIFIIILLYFTKTLLSNKESWMDKRFRTKCQVAIQYLLYQKALKTKQFSTETIEKDKKDGSNTQDDHAEKQQEGKQAEIFNLISTDADEFGTIVWAVSETWVSIIDLSITLYLLYYKLGPSMFNGIIVFSAAFIFNYVVAHSMIILHKKIQVWNDKRVALSTDVIEGIKSIQYLSWEDIFNGKIYKLRQKEFRLLVLVRSLDGGLVIFWNSITYLLLFVFLTSYQNEGHELSDTNVFTIIALFGFLTYPIGILPWSIGSIIKRTVNYRRIQSYMNQVQIDPTDTIRVIQVDQNLNEDSARGMNRPSSTVSAIHRGSGNNYEDEKEFKEESDKETLIFKKKKENRENPGNLAIEMKHMKFIWPERTTTENQKQVNEKMSASRRKYLTNNLLGVDDNLHHVEKQKFELTIEKLEIQKGSLNFVIGKIGTGQTALMKSILNEMDRVDPKKQHGHSEILNDEFQSIRMNSFFQGSSTIIYGSIAYVSQNHWLQNSSIRDNITFGKPYNEDFFRKCIQMCQLEQDLRIFPKRDLKLISASGSNLSGGQKQRISLCRAIYQDCDIYIFDDIFSSLDIHVCDSIFKQAIMQHLIAKNQTVIFVTSHYQYLSEPNSRIILMEDGMIVESENQKQKFIQQVIEEELKKEEEEKEFPVDLPVIQKKKSSQKSNSSGGSQSDQKAAGLGDKGADDDDDDQEEEKNEEKREKGQVKWDTMVTYLRECSYILGGLVVVTNFLMQATRTLIDFWLRAQVTPSDTLFDPMDQYFGSFEATFTFLIAMNLIITFFRALFYIIASNLAAYRMYAKLSKSIIFARMKFFDDNPPGRVISRVSKDMETIDDYLPWLLHVFLEDLAISIGIPIGIVIQFPLMIIFMIISVYLIVKSQDLYRPSNRQMKRLGEVNNAIILTHINQTCQGSTMIRAFEKEDYMMNQYKRKLQDSINLFTTSGATSSWNMSTLLFISNFILTMIGLSAIFILLFEVDVPSSSISMTITYGMIFTGTFCGLVWKIAEIEKNFVSVERIQQYMDLDVEDVNKIDPVVRLKRNKDIQVGKQDLEASYSSNQAGSSEEGTAIAFQNVFLTYYGIENEQNNEKKNTVTEAAVATPPIIQYALQNVNLKIKIGEKIAFCGRTGSGKTSILNALFRMYPLERGKIEINAVDYSTLSLKDLRKRISIIPQFGFLYNATLQDNLDPENQFSRQYLEHFYWNSGLRIRHNESNESSTYKPPSPQKSRNTLDTISLDSSSPNLRKENKIQANKAEESKVDFQIVKNNELEFVIENSGNNLSNGEKQIINFLRIMLRDTEIICIDEATSNMDPKTDQILNDKLFEFVHNKTLIVITHRLENIQKYDRVIVMEQGEIVEQGNVSELREIKGGFFNQLLEEQM